MKKSAQKHVGILVAIKPPEIVNKNIIKSRQYINKANGLVIYGNSDAHITLFVNSYKNFSEADKLISAIAAKHKAFAAKIDGLFDFAKDPINKTHTIVYKVAASAQLRRLQKDITNKLNKIRTDYQEKSMIEKKLYANEQERKNILKYGFPFGPEKWTFHATIGSIKANKFKSAWQHAQRYNLQKKWRVDSIGVYIYLGTDGFVLFKEYALKK